MHSPLAKKSGLKGLKRKSRNGRARLLIYAPNGEEYKTPHQRAPRVFWVYEIVDNGVCQYIGMTWMPKKRLSVHRSAGTASRTAVMRLVEQFRDEVSAMDAEIAHIQRMQPPLNKSHNNRMPNDQAYEFWKRVDLPAHKRLVNMPGWTTGQASYAFTRRLIADGLMESYP